MATRTRRLDLRLTREHKDLIERAAQATGQPVTSFVLSSVLERARETLDAESRTVLSKRDWASFLRILDAGAVAPALARAVRRSRRRDG
jgi:uncharacterized protein (DUF1778 family)